VEREKKLKRKTGQEGEKKTMDDTTILHSKKRRGIIE
jgi:hypothetical protein